MVMIALRLVSLLLTLNLASGVFQKPNDLCTRPQICYGPCDGIDSCIGNSMHYYVNGECMDACVRPTFLRLKKAVNGYQCGSCTSSFPAKSSWPELVGTKAAAAKTAILRETANAVYVVILAMDENYLGDFDEKRVRIFTFPNGTVSPLPMVPRIG